MNRDDLLATAGSLISGDRQATYGKAIDNFTRTGRLWGVVLGIPDVPPDKVALCMALLKVDRLFMSPGHEDTWVDMLGYIALGGEIATGN